MILVRYCSKQDNYLLIVVFPDMFKNFDSPLKFVRFVVLPTTVHLSVLWIDLLSAQQSLVVWVCVT